MGREQNDGLKMNVKKMKTMLVSRDYDRDRKEGKTEWCVMYHVCCFQGPDSNLISFNGSFILV